MTESNEVEKEEYEDVTNDEKKIPFGYYATISIPTKDGNDELMYLFDKTKNGLNKQFADIHDHGGEFDIVKIVKGREIPFKRKTIIQL